MPEGTRRATLNQELIQRMINTSEMVPIEKRLVIIDKYAGKLLNIEYTVQETRRVIVDGLKDSQTDTMTHRFHTLLVY